MITLVSNALSTIWFRVAEDLAQPGAMRVELRGNAEPADRFAGSMPSRSCLVRGHCRSARQAHKHGSGAPREQVYLDRRRIPSVISGPEWLPFTVADIARPAAVGSYFEIPCRVRISGEGVSIVIDDLPQFLFESGGFFVG